MGGLRVLVACEYSGRVREAFRKRGHDAWSCDLLPAEDGSEFHHQGDVLPHLGNEWDLMIAHPPCTYLTVAGMHWNKNPKHARGQMRSDGLTQGAWETERALDFVLALMNAPIPKICIENPISIISTRIRKPDVIVQPWQHGHPESKQTCLWLKNLPVLKPTNIVPKPESGVWANQTPSGQNKLGPSEDRWKIRSRTYEGIAQAMAEQWG